MNWRTLFTGAAAVSAAGWTALVLFRGDFWNGALDAHLAASATDAWDGTPPRVHAVVPARDEADVIARTLPALAAQRYGGPFRIVLVDDESVDDTARVARASLDGHREADRVAILPARPLEPGWTGKVGALESGVRVVRATEPAPRWWFFTDADVEHDPDNLAALVAKGEREGLDMLSLMVRLHCENRWERLLIPAFVFFFAKLYPFAWSNDPRRRTAAAAGGCVLLSDAALQRIGGLHAIRDRLIDDCALAAAVKSSGGRIWLGLSGRTRSVRPYPDLDALWSMIARTAFVQLRGSYALVALTVAGLVVLYVVPPVATVAGLLRRDGWLAGAGGSAWLLMSGTYLPTLKAYGRPPLAALGLSVAALLYATITVDSALASARRLGATWKGRWYDGDIRVSE